MRRLTTLISLAIVALLLAAACQSAAPTPTPVPKGLLDWVPADAAVLVSAQIQKALEDVDIKDGFAQVAEAVEADFVPTLDEALQEVQEASGLNLKGIKEAVLFFTGDIYAGAEDSGGPQGAVILKGSYDRAKIIAALGREKGPPKTTTYNGVELLTSEENALAFLEGDLLAIGSVAGVQAVIDVRKGTRPALAGDLLKSFKAMGSPLIKLSVKFPAGFLEKQLKEGDGKLGELPIDLSLFTQIQSLGLSIDKKLKEFALNLTLDFPDVASAKKASDGLGGLIAFLKAFSGKPELGALLDKLQIGSVASQVSIAAQFNAQEIGDAVKALAQGFGE